MIKESKHYTGNLPFVSWRLVDSSLCPDLINVTYFLCHFLFVHSLFVTLLYYIELLRTVFIVWLDKLLYYILSVNYPKHLTYSTLFLQLLTISLTAHCQPPYYPRHKLRHPSCWGRSEKRKTLWVTIRNLWKSDETEIKPDSGSTIVHFYRDDYV